MIYTHNLRTARIHEIAQGLADDGQYMQAATLEELAEQRDELAHVLRQIVGQAEPNRWGYDAAYIAMQDTWRTDAREALRKVQK